MRLISEKFNRFFRKEDLHYGHNAHVGNRFSGMSAINSL